MSEMSVAEPEQVETAAASEARWSDRAVRRLTQAWAIGLLAVMVGAVLFAAGEARDTAVSSLLTNGGLTLLVVGLIVIVAARRTRSLAPDRSFVPGAIVRPRMWFILFWGGGIAIAVAVSVFPIADAVEQIIMLPLAIGLLTAGGLWMLYWLSGQLITQWPAAAISSMPLRWLPAWAIVWSGVWGLVSTLLALVIEVMPTLLAALLFRSSFNLVSRSTVSPYESLLRVLHNPVLIVLVIIGAVVAAPAIEEAVKALGLRWLRPTIQRPRDGWLLGFAAGLGFGILEGAFNLDSAGTWIVGGWVRLAALLLHGLATSLTGLGYARYLQSKQRSDLWRGYGHAVIMHGAWNACAIGLAVAFGAMGTGIFDRSGLAACAGVLMLIGLIVFMVVLIRRVSTAGVQTSIQEDFQLADVPLPMGWRPMKFNLGWRLVAGRPIEVPVTVRSESPVTHESPLDEAYRQRVEGELKDE